MNDCDRHTSRTKTNSNLDHITQKVCEEIEQKRLTHGNRDRAKIKNVGKHSAVFIR